METYTYDVYGKPTMYDASHTEIPESQFGNRFYFTGREFDKESGLYYYRARYYDPALGRFMSPDPIGAAGGPNLYTYCGNNSVNLVDPMGLMIEKPKIEPDEWNPPPRPPLPWDNQKSWDLWKKIRDWLIPPAEAYRDYDEMLDEMDRRAREGEPQRAGDIAFTKEEVQEAAQKINKLRNEILKSIWKGWKKWFEF